MKLTADRVRGRRAFEGAPMTDDLVSRLLKHHEAMRGPDYYQAATALSEARAKIERLRITLSWFARQNTKLRDELNQRYMAEVATREIGYVSSDNHDWDPLEWDPIEFLHRSHANGDDILEPAITAIEEAYVDIDKLWAALDTTKDELSALRARVREVVGPFAGLTQRYDDTVSDGWIPWAEFVTDHEWLSELDCRAARRLMEELK